MANYISSYIIDYNDSKQLKYGVINLCDNTTYYGSTTWSVTNNGGLTGLTVGGSPVKGVTLSTNNSKYLVITNTYTGTASDPEITVKASSNLVSCDTNNTCKITLRRACQRQYVKFELEINDDSKEWVNYVGGYNTLYYGKNSSSSKISNVSTVDVSKIGINYPDSNLEDVPILGNCSIALDPGDKLYFGFNDISIRLSLKNNVQNIVVSGEVKYKFNDDTYTTLDSLSSDVYTYSSTSDYPIKITGCNYKTTKLHDLMDGLKTLHIRHVINLKYDSVAAIEEEYVIIFKKNGSTITSIENINKPFPMTYTFDVYYKASNSSTEQSASGIITSVSSSSTYYNATFNGNTVKLTKKIVDIGDVIPNDIQFNVKVCIKPNGASSNTCDSLPVHFKENSPIVSEPISVTINWSISYPSDLMLYNHSTSIDVDLNNEVHSNDTSGSITKTYISGTTSTNISVNFSMEGAGYINSDLNYSGKKVSTLIHCSELMNPSSSSGNNIGCCLGSTGDYLIFSNGAIDFTSNFNNVHISNGDTININIRLTVV